LIKRSEIETFISLDELLSMRHAYLEEDLTENQAKTKKQLHLAYQKKILGQSDDDLEG
jgi:hypothetical protein